MRNYETAADLIRSIVLLRCGQIARVQNVDTNFLFIAQPVHFFLMILYELKQFSRTLQCLSTLSCEVDQSTISTVDISISFEILKVKKIHTDRIAR